MEKQALEGIRVADFTWQWAGPYGMMLLAFMGAEVIKIESRGRIDASRVRHSLSHPANLGINQGNIFHQLNVNKLSVTLNLSNPKAVDLAKRIVKLSDIVAENFRPGVMDRLGLGYSALREVKPDIIMLSSSAQGSTGPEKGYIGFAPQQASVAGRSHLTGYVDGLPVIMHGNPDLECAAMSTFAVLAALHYRCETGKGQFIDLAQTEVITSLIGEAIMDYTVNRNIQSRNGNRDDVMAPHNCYRCRGEDDWISIAVCGEREWRAFCNAIGNPDWTNGEEFVDAHSRWQNQTKLDSFIEEWTRTKSKYEAMEILQEAGVSAMPSFSNKDIANDSHLRERDMFIRVKHSEIGENIVLGPPWKFSSTPAKVSRAAPLLGEHNRYVFCDLLELSEEEVNQLVKEEVIF